MNVKENYSLLNYNTFGIGVVARYFVELSSNQDIQEFLEFKNYKKLGKLFLGGGSNILFTKDFDGIVVKVNNSGIDLIQETKDYFTVSVGAGMNWHSFVMYCIDKGYSGIENLSLIPGNVGAAPMQNIGAYGVELKDVFKELEAINLETGEVCIFSKKDCGFGYRTSVFKRELKNKYVITRVVFNLFTKPNIQTSYGAIEHELENMKVSELSIRAVSEAVCRIRSSKLPLPSELGNAGSFFKNPTISVNQYNEIKKTFRDISGYSNPDSLIKVPAAWLIENCKWKGFRKGDAGVHKNHALVLCNYGNASGKEIFNLSEEIKLSVKDKFNIELEREVNVY